jgi:hypothetical protein
MGCDNTKQKQYYSDIDLDEEKEIREFEKEIGGFAKTLNQILPRICIERDIIPIHNVEDYILKDFSQMFLGFIQQGYFYKDFEGEKYYDAKKITILIFLITNNSQVDNGHKIYHDKASFIFNYIRCRNDQNLSEPLNDKEDTFIEFMNDVVEVACEGIVDCFFKYKDIKRDSFITKLKDFKKDISQYITEKLFFSKHERDSRSVTFDELNELFEKDKWAFTSGYIRELAWEILKGGKGNEIEKERREKESKEAEEEQKKN